MRIKNLENKRLIDKENKLFIYILIAIGLFSAVIVSCVFWQNNSTVSRLGFTLDFIKFFNFVLSMLAFGSCLILHNRLKRDSIFIISLMYLCLGIGILMGHVDYLSFYQKGFTLQSYITVSTSLLRICILITTLIPKSNVNKLIVNNKFILIIFVVLYSIIFGALENKLYINSIYDNKQFFLIYNIFLVTVYIIASIKLMEIGIKEKEYFFAVLSSSVFMLALKAMYAIYGTNIASFFIKLTSVSITYICFLLVIAGAFIELYMYIARTKILNDDLSVFFTLVDDNKHNFMFICNQDREIVYANKRIKEYYLGTIDADIKELEDAINKRKNLLNEREIEVKKILDKYGFWRGVIRNDEEDRTVDCSIQVISQNGCEQEIAVTYIDISDEINKQLEIEKFKVYDREKSEFIANLSHELRTPLNIFYSTIQLLEVIGQRGEIEFKQAYDKYKKTLQVNCSRMLRLINNVVDMSKIDSGMLTGDFKNYDIVAVVEEVTLSVVNYAALKSINIQFDTEVEEQIIKCDALMIERMLLNLLSNSIKFSDKDKNIYVDIFVKGEWVEIYVKDEGIGIPEDIQDRIFEKFVQADKTFTRMNEGSGIGLSIVKYIIDLHKGIISVESKEMEGSIFKILLPNKQIEDLKPEFFDAHNINTELELSDIYEVLD